MDFELDKLRQKVDLETPEGKVAFLRDCAQLLAGVNNRLEREVYASKIAQELSVDKAPLMLSIEDVIKKRTRQRQKQEKRDLRMYSQVSASGQRQAPAAVQSKDLKAQVSQGKLLAMLLRYPDFYELVSRKLTPQDFTVEENRLIYEAMSARFARGETVDLLSLGAALTQEQMAKLSGWLASVSGMNFTKEDAVRYVDSILAQREQKTQTDIAQMNEEELNAYIHSLASKKKS
ncbi:MAG: DnaB-like helicase N-terminal domain-containing protein [Oscillospiraceae bacterium]